MLCQVNTVQLVYRIGTTVVAIVTARLGWETLEERVPGEGKTVRGFRYI